MAEEAPPAAKVLSCIQAGRTILQAIEDFAEDLKSLNHEIHSCPELAFEEFQAHDNISSLLEQHGFNVTRHAYGIETSLEAIYGSGGRLVTFNAEYDALPGIGHACGHNLLATASVAAFIAVAYIVRESTTPGRVRLLGTPAEEGGGGKIKLIAAGAFDGVNACFLNHPIPATLGPVQGYSGIADPLTDATTKVSVTFTGKAAHPTMAPWQGKNALDAAVLSHNAISMLRQQIRPSERIHGVISNGGTRTNIITETACMEYQFRADSRPAVDALRKRVENCFYGAATATGCSVEIKEGLSYAEMRINKVICSEFAAAMEGLGSPVACKFQDAVSRVPASGDQGNVSYVCPAFHGGFSIPTGKGDFNHTPGFATASGTEEAFQATLEAAKGMAIVGLKVLQDDDFATRVRADFDEDCRRREES
ncbi:hypothetical protein NA57DRAFT_71116 [Rhizodiscina lignyota]|uniref:Peptidase M20 domain-containing protein 2 n=1 Tax=Rhizodiscina lignyota TaxID=1504668 RepID=A0A9P4INT9_9PEZI|nr:hypothetical protein NA57DRAFT_71116 [Rhizodiscina lignyota]